MHINVFPHLNHSYNKIAINQSQKFKLSVKIPPCSPVLHLEEFLDLFCFWVFFFKSDLLNIRCTNATDERFSPLDAEPRSW